MCDNDQQSGIRQQSAIKLIPDSGRKVITLNLGEMYISKF